MFLLRTAKIIMTSSTDQRLSLASSTSSASRDDRSSPHRNRKSASSTSCFSSDDTEFLELPKSVAAHSKRFKTSCELRIMEDNHKGHQRNTLEDTGQNNLSGVTVNSTNSATTAAKRTFKKSETKATAKRHQSPSAGSVGSESAISSRWSSSDEETSAYNDRSTYSKDSEYNNNHNREAKSPVDEEDEENGEGSSRDGLDDVEGDFLGG